MKTLLNALLTGMILVVVSGCCSRGRDLRSDLKSQRTITANQRIGTLGDLQADPAYREIIRNLNK